MNRSLASLAILAATLHGAACGGRVVEDASGSSTGGSSGASLCTPVSGLLAYYPLDTDTLDHSGNGNDAIGSGIVATPGKVGGAYSFDGATSFLHATGSATLQGARTLCAWVRPSPREGLGQPVFSGGQSGTGDFFSIHASSPGPDNCPLVPNTPFVDHWGNACNATVGTPLTVDAWHFVCYAFDGGASVTFYEDGSAVPASGAEYSYPLDTLYVGSAVIGGTSSAPSLLGTLDEVTVWTRALDAGDVAALWAGGAGCAAR